MIAPHPLLFPSKVSSSRLSRAQLAGSNHASSTRSCTFPFRCQRRLRSGNLWIRTVRANPNTLLVSFRLTSLCLLSACCFLLSAFCLLPLTRYLLLTTYYLLPTTYCPLPTTYYLLPATYYLLPTTYCPLPTTCYLLLTTYYLLPTTCYLLFVTCSLRAPAGLGLTLDACLKEFMKAEDLGPDDLWRCPK